MESQRARLQELVASGQVRLQPLSFIQRELWETSPVAPEDPSNHIRSFIDLKGPLTHELCMQAMRLVVARQEVMRTSILPGKERPVQMIRARSEPVVDYRAPDRTGIGDEEIIAMMEEGFRRPFDLVRGPLYRLQMVRRGPDHHALGLTIHHAIADGWTVTSFVEDLYTACLSVFRESGRDMTKLHGKRDLLPPLAVTYSEWAASERARWRPAETLRHADYWVKRLEGVRPLFGGAPAGPERLEQWVTDLPAELADAVRATARRCGVTLFGALLAAFRLALLQWRNADDVVVGTPVAGRAKSALKETMGSFSGIVPLRAKVGTHRPFEETVRITHEQAVEDFTHAMPFVELAAAVERRVPRVRHAVFDVRFAVQNHPFPGIEIAGMAPRLRNLSSGTSRFDIACELTEDGRKMELIWLHRPSAAACSEIEDLDRLFRSVLEAGCRRASGQPRNSANN
ncbi:MAG: condensation domain protein [Chthoniobacterales bacterium]|nr:condensation domain protein [Chthoniobacterales bacterium]